VRKPRTESQAKTLCSVYGKQSGARTSAGHVGRVPQARYSAAIFLRQRLRSATPVDPHWIVFEPASDIINGVVEASDVCLAVEGADLYARQLRPI